jgi:endogenous inhibitor of DNA gyrase (YacG/DUF329 family)
MNKRSRSRKQLTLVAYDLDGYGDLEIDKPCEHCGLEHTAAGPYCSARCAQLARSNADENMLIEYEPEVDRQDDRDDCSNYWGCLIGLNDDEERVCKPGCKGYKRDTEPLFEVMRSNMGMVLR